MSVRSIFSTSVYADMLAGSHFSHEGSGKDYTDVYRSEGAKQFKQKKKRRKIAKASKRMNRRG